MSSKFKIAALAVSAQNRHEDEAARESLAAMKRKREASRDARTSSNLQGSATTPPAGAGAAPTRTQIASLSEGERWEEYAKILESKGAEEARAFFKEHLES